MAVRGSDTAGSREQAIIAAYKAGKKWSELEAEFGVGRSTLSHVLRRSGTLPNRARRKLDQGSAEQALAGLYELIAHQDRRIAELEAENQRYEAKLRRLGATGNGDRGTRKKTANRSKAAERGGATNANAANTRLLG